MSYVQKISLLARRSNIKQTYFSCICKSGTMKEQIVAFSSMESFNCKLFTCPAIEKISKFSIFQPVKQFCTVQHSQLTQEKNNNDLMSVPFSSFNEIDLTNSDLINTFRNLVLLEKNMKSKSYISFKNDIEQFASSNEFKNFCNSLEKKLPLLTAEELKLLLNLANFNVLPSCVLMQKIYHLIIEKINEYGPIDIISIYETIISSLHKDNPKCKVLQIICKDYFKFKLVKDLNYCNDFNAIAYFCKSDKVPLFVKKQLMAKLGRNFHIIHREMTLSSLCRMFAAFWDNSLNSYFKPEMLDIIKKRIAEKPSFLQTRNILIGLKHLSLKHVEYEESFYNALVENSIEKNTSIKATLELSKNFLELGHFTMPLVKHFEKAFLDPKFGLKSQKLSHEAANVLSVAYYHPHGYEGNDANHIECIKKLESFEYKMAGIKEFVDWCFCLTVLGSERKIKYINELFTYLTETSYNGASVDLGPATLESIITLHAFCRRHFPTDVHELSETFLNKCHKALESQCNKVPHDILGNFFDVNAQVFEFCTSSLHHFIDYAVLIGENATSDSDTLDKTPNSILKIDSIKRSPSSKLILYHMYHGSFPAEFKNSPVLPGKLQLIQQSYEKFNCSVVFIHEKFSSRMDHAQQVSYIAKKVKESIQQQ